MTNWEKSAKLLQHISGFEEFCESYLKIQPKSGGESVPFRLNPIQRWVIRHHVAPRWREGLPIRIAFLKARQFGISTLFMALNYWQTLGHESWNSLVIGQEESQTRGLFRMIRRFDDAIADVEGDVLPYFARSRDAAHIVEFRQPAKTNRFQSMRKRPDALILDSRIEVKSAHDKGALGRSGTYHSVHASEVAFWPDLTSSLGALLQACHEQPETMVAMETTANGMNAFYSFWKSLGVADSEIPSIWQKVFLPWYWSEDYELPLDIAREFKDEEEEALFLRITNDEVLKWQIEGRELALKRVWAKLFWRRQVLRDRCNNDVELFKQEFPSNDSEAFMFTGVSVLSASTLARLEHGTREPVWRGMVELVEPHKDAKRINLRGSKKVEMTPSLVAHSHGRLRIFEHPMEHAEYCIFADVAEGKAIEGINEDKSKWDFSCAQILKVTSIPMEQVAVWHGNCDPDEFGDILVALAIHYRGGRGAYLGWEINGPGRSIALQVRNRGYNNVYMREDFDTLTARKLSKPGWVTTSKTKPRMVGVLQQATRDEEVLVYDSSTVMELKTFSRIGQNKYEAATGHDDRVIALAGALTIVEPLVEGIRNRSMKDKDKKEEFSRSVDDFGPPLEFEDEVVNPVLGSEF